MSNISIDKLNEHLFEAIEMLKNSNDPNASENEKIDVETAKAISSLGKVAIEGYKVKCQALAILSKADNPNIVKETLSDSGFLNNPKVIECKD